jgi:hypothetical protein
MTLRIPPATKPRVYCVLRQSTVYTTARVEWLRRQLPGVELIVLGDHKGATIPLLFNWPGWWSKLELCRPDIPGDVFFMDLDTVHISGVEAFTRPRPTTFLSDFYRPANLQSSVMYLTASDRAYVWSRWMTDPAGHIANYSVRRPGHNGDQNFMEAVLTSRVARWQDDPTTPVCSYKVDYLKGHDPTAGLIVFHGRPRPWDLVGAPWNR